MYLTSIYIILLLMTTLYSLAIALLQSSGKLRMELAVNAFLDIKDNFSLEKTSTLYRQLFWQLIEEKEKKVHIRKTTKPEVDIEDESREDGEFSNKELRQMAEEDFYRRQRLEEEEIAEEERKNKKKYKGL